jgi:hypothetical protein
VQAKPQVGSEVYSYKHEENRPQKAFLTGCVGILEYDEVLGNEDAYRASRIRYARGSREKGGDLH